MRMQQKMYLETITTTHLPDLMKSINFQIEQVQQI